MTLYLPPHCCSPSYTENSLFLGAWLTCADSLTCGKLKMSVIGQSSFRPQFIERAYLDEKKKKSSKFSLKYKIVMRYQMGSRGRGTGEKKDTKETPCRVHLKETE